ncbi:agmatine deiminase (plasmid) [Lichenicola cladoniae]|uniref:Putative agmatine deiminase n=1 Tax=Lichenicola cladoniae TaxID=1484109 RepID=A0A6M8HYW7_9PROT|nr:agmatine deiminase [Lichenicola cladoniae]NPD70197.1 agmatine deiminase [Acetobacteraceae bacterium]QKE93592.1 agmatine deiminase [Lichenicola cladoniae]
MAGSEVTRTTLTSRPSSDGFWMPPEWAPQEAVWMLWPYRPDNWREAARPAQEAYAAVAEAIMGATPVIMGVPAEFMAQAERRLPAGINLVSMASDDAWIRDSGPSIVVDTHGERRGVSWIFNAYGGLKGGLYSPWDRDAQVSSLVCDHHHFARYAAPLVMEGGSIHSDGEGTLLVTEEVLLNPDRNPALTKQQIGDFLEDYLNIDKIIWLPSGVFADETSGHVDNICCFSRPAEVILTWTEDATDPQAARSQAALAVLECEVDAKGRSFKVHKVQQPGPLTISNEEAVTTMSGPGMNRRAGTRLAGSYVNFLITNGRLILPMLDRATDEQALSMMRDIFPKHEVIGVPAREILLGGGNIHCITQQVPAGAFLSSTHGGDGH